MFKGISPVIAIILLVGVTVGSIITAYIGINSLTDDIKDNTEKSIIKEFDARGADLKVDVFGNCKIYLRNTGIKDVPIEAINLYVDDKPVNYEPSTGLLKTKDVVEINFLDLDYKKYEVKIKLRGNLLDQGYMVCTNGTPVYDFSCSVRYSGCNAEETEVLALSDITNGFAELATEGNYNYKLCCRNITSVTTTSDKNCGEFYTGLISLSGNTNAFVEEFDLPRGSFSFTNKTSICVELNGNARLNCDYTTLTNCEKWGWHKIISMSSLTNANIGNINAYPNHILCCTTY